MNKKYQKRKKGQDKRTNLIVIPCILAIVLLISLVFTVLGSSVSIAFVRSIH